MYSNFSVSELNDAHEDQTSSPAPLSQESNSDEEKKKSRFSRMFAANVSKLLSAGDLEELQDPPIREGFMIKKMV